MTNPSPTPQALDSESVETITPSVPAATEPQPSYTKLAMRNMVRKGGTSLTHFAITTIGLVTVLLALAYLTR